MAHRSFALAFLAGCALLGSVPAAAGAPADQPEARYVFDIPAQPLASAILEFSRQSGVVVLAPEALTSGKVSGGVSGEMAPEPALKKLLNRSGLSFHQGAAQSYVIVAPSGLMKTSVLDPEEPAVTPAPVRDDRAPEGTQSEQSEPAAIVVTGTHLKSGSFASPTPVTAIDSQQISDRSEGSIFEVLKDVPTFRSTSGPSENSTGAQSASKANLDLRGLGSNRTLVLVNGRRHVADGTSNVWDTNLIPSILIDRIDVVTGGASAAYGSDAVAGVVNFVLKNRFEGLEMDLRGGESQRGDDQEYAPSFAFGRSFMDGRLHLVVGGDVTLNRGTGTMYDRSWGKLEPGALSISASAIPNRVALGLPANIIANHVETSAYNASGLITSGPLKGTAFADGGATYQMQYGAINGGTEMIGTGDYGSVENPDQALRPAYQRGAALGRLEYDLAPDTTVFAQFQYGALRTHGKSFGARVPNFDNYPVLINNPFLPQSVVSAMQADGLNQFTYSASRQQDVGSIESHNSTDSYQTDFGLNGSVFGDWKWDAGGGAGYAAFKPFITNTPRTADFFESAYVVPGPDGQPVCGPVATNPYFNAQPAVVRQELIANLSPGCVPYNIFGTNKTENQAALAYFDSASAADFEFREYTATANLSGVPVKLPSGDVSVAVGAEWRRDTLSSVNCADCQRGALMNQNYSLFSGAQNVAEVYTEAGIPILADRRFFRNLEANAAIRETDYSTSGAVTTWKVGMVWDLDTQLRLRATRSHDIRAPNINELYNPGSEGNPNVVNQVTGASGFIKSNTVGNPDLKPEIGDTYTYGAVFQPTWNWASGFRIAVDYWNIDIKDVIATLDPQTLLNDVLTNPSSVYQQYVIRDDTALGVSRVNVPELNLNAMKTDGIDFEIAYRIPINSLSIPGALSIHAIGTEVRHSRTITATTDVDQAGTAAAPGSSWTINTDYSFGNFAASLMTRYTSPIKYSATLVGPDDPRYSVALPNSVNRNLWPEALYFNTYTAYTFHTRGGSALRLYFNIDNLLDKQPPIVAISINGSPWDLIGRAFKLGLDITL